MLAQHGDKIRQVFDPKVYGTVDYHFRHLTRGDWTGCCNFMHSIAAGIKEGTEDEVLKILVDSAHEVYTSMIARNASSSSIATAIKSTIPLNGEIDDFLSAHYKIEQENFESIFFQKSEE